MCIYCKRICNSEKCKYVFITDRGIHRGTGRGGSEEGAGRGGSEDFKTSSTSSHAAGEEAFTSLTLSQTRLSAPQNRMLEASRLFAPHVCVIPQLVISPCVEEREWKWHSLKPSALTPFLFQWRSRLIMHRSPEIKPALSDVTFMWLRLNNADPHRHGANNQYEEIKFLQRNLSLLWRNSSSFGSVYSLNWEDGSDHHETGCPRQANNHTGQLWKQHINIHTVSSS